MTEIPHGSPALFAGMEKLPAACAGDAGCRQLADLQQRPEIFAALSGLTGSELSRQAKLRKSFPDDLVRLALLMDELRRKAAGKFARADRMWFDRVGLEQATAEAIARHKARRFPADAAVWDFCCGIGGDALALAEHHQVTVVDRQPAALWRTAANAAVYGVQDRLEYRLSEAELCHVPPEVLVHIDPDRRGGKPSRVNRLEDYLPNLEFLQQLPSRCRGGAIKVGPASNFGGKFPDAEIELVSLHGECKEATIWFGELTGPEPFRATVLPSGESLAGHPLSTVVDVTPLAGYIYDPDPAVVRAGLVDLCAEQLRLTRLDAAEEYLTSPVLVTSPFVTPFRVLAELPNNERDLRQTLRDLHGGRYEIKCRHVPLAAEVLRRKLPEAGDAALTIILARLNGKTRWVVAERVSADVVCG